MHLRWGLGEPLQSSEALSQSRDDATTLVWNDNLHPQSRYERSLYSAAGWDLSAPVGGERVGQTRLQFDTHLVA